MLLLELLDSCEVVGETNVVGEEDVVTTDTEEETEVAVGVLCADVDVAADEEEEMVA